MAVVGLGLVLGSSGVRAQTSGGEPAVHIPVPTDFVTDIDRSERVLSEVEADLESHVLEGLKRFDWRRAIEGLSAGFAGTFPGPDQGQLVSDAQLVVRRFGAHDGSRLDRDGLLSVLRRHTADWTSVERASWHTFEFLLAPAGDTAFLRAHLQIGGPAPSGARSFLDLTVDASVVLTDDRWGLDRLAVTDGTLVRNPGSPFRDITNAVGFHFNRSGANLDLRQDIVDTRASLVDSSLSVVDWNRDGFWDLIATESMNQAVLFLNDGKGGFTRGMLPFDDPRLIPAQVLFVDLDGDGLEELVGNRTLYRDGRGFFGVYTRRDDEWIFLPNALSFANPSHARRTDAQPMTVGDIDGDGRLDVVIGGYETDQSRDPQRFNRVDAQDGAETLLFMNQGGLRFTEEAQTRGLSGSRYTYVVQLFDFDADGDLDLFEGNDYGRNELWENEGGQFRAQPDHPLSSDASNTMGITIADWDNTGQWSVHLSNMYSHAGSRIVRQTRTLGPEMRDQLAQLARGNQLFTQELGRGGWTDQAVPLGINAAGWAWASLFFDADNDGDQDLFVTNGNTSHRDPDAPDY